MSPADARRVAELLAPATAEMVRAASTDEDGHCWAPPEVLAALDDLVAAHV